MLIRQPSPFFGTFVLTSGLFLFDISGVRPSPEPKCRSSVVSTAMCIKGKRSPFESKTSDSIGSRSMVRIHKKALGGRHETTGKTTSYESSCDKSEGFAFQEPWRQRVLHGLRPDRQIILFHSPEAHQNLSASAPELCSGAHQ